MNKIILVVALLFPALLIASPHDPYASIYGAYSMTEVDDNSMSYDYDNLGVSFALGTRLGVYLRGEVELGTRGADDKSINFIKDGKHITGKLEASSTLGLVNGFFDFTNRSPFTPYFGLSLGIGQVKVEKDATVNASGTITEVQNEFSKAHLAYGALIGFKYRLAVNLGFDMKYRFIDYGKFDDAGHTIDTRSSEINVGFSYLF